MKEFPIISSSPDPIATPPAAAAADASSLTPDPLATLALKPQILEVLHTVYDPEIPVNIYELGLIYDVIVDVQKIVGIRMTLTAPGCPAAQSLPAEVERKVRALAGVTDVKVEVVWEPPWDRERMSDVAKLKLGLL